MENRTLNQIQKEVDLWAKQFQTPYFSPLFQLVYMIEEVEHLLFNFICLINTQNIDLNKAYFRKVDKLYIRNQMRFE